MTTKEIPDYPRGITFEQVWAALMEDREHLKEAERRMKEEVAERQKETDRRQKEAAEREMKEAERQKVGRIDIEEIKKIVRRNSKQMDDLHRRFGQINIKKAQKKPVKPSPQRSELTVLYLT